MPFCLDNFGIGFFYENEETMSSMIEAVVRNGQAKYGYYGRPYINCHYGDIQMIARCKKNEQGDGWILTGFDAHADSNCAWVIRSNGMRLQSPDSDKLSKRIAVSNEDGKGLAIINVMNADVLPCYMKDELIRMQMIALPSSVEYYPDEDAYFDQLPASQGGKKFGVANGTIFPAGFMQNHMTEEETPPQNAADDGDDLCLIMGTVKKLNRGLFVLGGKEYRPYIECVIDTQFGQLPIVHTIDQVPEDQRKNIAIGAIISVTAVLSGDVTIDAYSDGIVRDEEHALKLFRSVVCGDDPERLRGILAEDASYYAEYNHQFYFRPDEIIDRLKAVQENHQEANDYYAFPATIVSIDEGDEEVPYSVGKRCLVLALGEETNYETIVFIDLNDDGNIIRLVTTANPRYHFSIDPKPKQSNPFDNYILPQSVTDSILARARFHDIIDNSVSNQDVLTDTDYAYEFENNICEMLKSFPHTEEPEEKNPWANLFGYLFAKAIEMEYAQTQSFEIYQPKHICSYSVEDVLKGTIHSALTPEQNKRLQDALELGKQFYKDFVFFQEISGSENDQDSLKKALMLVQTLGKLYSHKCL